MQLDNTNDATVGAGGDATDAAPTNQLDLFVEVDQVLALIDALPATLAAGTFEKSYEKYAEILARYQEQPHLLDPHLEQLLGALFAHVRAAADGGLTPLAHAAYKCMYQLSKVRTFKVLVKSLPHEIADLPFVLGSLEQLDATADAAAAEAVRNGEPPAAASTVEWETRYVLLLWLSILVLNPFQLSRLDGTAAADGAPAPTPITERLYAVCVRSTRSSDTCSRAAAHLAARYLTRCDTTATHLPRFLRAICEQQQRSLRTGQLDAIAAILKHGKREDLLPHTAELLVWVLASGYKESGDYLLAKQFVKIVQRIGLVLLRPRLAQWRYQRGTRSLAANLQTKTETTTAATVDQQTIERPADDAQIYVPDAIEDVVDELLSALRSASGEVRWSAAKGLGRVCGRLPHALGDEVVGSVIDTLSPLEPHEAWHGGCLAIAELAKRGLLLPERLAVMVAVLQQALVYDEMRGYMSVGQHIRDAACYVAWAFARAYEPEVLAPFVGRISAALLVTTVFDREINCRRAASAAFQESVGRLGNFPHGIDILTEADFHAVGVRARAFLQIAAHVAQFEEYREPLVGHLVRLKCTHWDEAVRGLAARTLARLTPLEPERMAGAEVMGRLLKATASIDVNERHGALMALGEIVRALRELQRTEGGAVWLTPDLVGQLNALVGGFLRRDQFRGHSGDLMRAGCCDYIRNCSAAGLEASAECVAAWQTVVDACIGRAAVAQREAAAAALEQLAAAYYVDSGAEENAALIAGYLERSADELDEHGRMGCVAAVGALPVRLLRPALREVLAVLIGHALKARANAATEKWAEARREAIHAIGRVVAKFRRADADGEAKEATVDADVLREVLACYLQSLHEYTVDDRGDIGAWVREATMTELYALLTDFPSSDWLTPDSANAVMTGFCQQATEIIDRTRGLAGSLFCKMVHHESRIPHIPRHAELLELFPRDASTVLWIYADQTFPIFCALLQFPEYSPRLLLGLSASMGKLSESLVKHASAALFQYIHRHPTDVRRLCAEIIALFAANVQNDAISHPLLNFLDTLLASGCVTTELLDTEAPFADEIYRLTKLELKGQRKLYKIVSAIAVFCHLVQVPRLCVRVLSTLSIFLGQMHVHVRKCTAAKLYDALVIHGDACEETLAPENVEQVLELLSETDWGAPLGEVRPVRNQLCELLGIRAPVPVAAAAAAN